MVITYNMRTGETHCTPMTKADEEYAVQMLTHMFHSHQKREAAKAAAREKEVAHEDQES